MTREHKIALIVGFALVLLVGVAVSDHLSQARTAQLETGLTESESIAALESPRMRIPDATPMDRFAAAPEWPARDSIAMGTEVADAQEPDPSPRTDFLTRLRDRVQDMPIAAKTQTSEQRTEQVETPLANATTTAQSPTSESAPQSLANPPAASFSESDGVWHSVSDGETLWSIAQKHYGNGALAGKLAEFNGARASNPDLIRAGVRLRIPPRHVLTGEAVPTITQTPRTPKSAESFRLYTIKRGDTLGEIAIRELGTIKRMQEIVKLNENVLRDLDNIPVGATLRLPAK